MLLIKVGDVETNPGPTTIRKQVWICNICHRQIQVRKQILIRCNRIEHCVHQRCAGIRLAPYTYSWTCHQHRESRLTTPPPHPPRPSLILSATHPQQIPIPPRAKHIHMSHTPPTPLLLLSTHSLDLCLWGESDHPASGPPASLSLHLSVHKSRGDNVVCIWVQLKR